MEERLAELATIQPNWDSYGGYPITEAAIQAARSILKDKPTLYIYPTARGGIQLEWDDNTEVRIDPDGSIEEEE